MLKDICRNVNLKCIASIGYLGFSFFFDETRIPALMALLFLIIFDFVTAIFAAKKEGIEIKSSKIFRSAIKVLVYFMMVAAGHIIETVIGIGFFVDETVMIFLSVTEFISILENTGKLGFAIPQKLLNKLEQLRDSE